MKTPPFTHGNNLPNKNRPLYDFPLVKTCTKPLHLPLARLNFRTSCIMFTDKQRLVRPSFSPSVFNGFMSLTWPATFRDGGREETLVRF